MAVAVGGTYCRQILLARDSSAITAGTRRHSEELAFNPWLFVFRRFTPNHKQLNPGIESRRVTLAFIAFLLLSALIESAGPVDPLTGHSTSARSRSGRLMDDLTSHRSGTVLVPSF
jgi:hypothetical protein